MRAQRQMKIIFFSSLLLCLSLPLNVHAQLTYTTNDGAITITEYTGPGGVVTIPGMIDGLPVTRIGENAFYNASSLTGVTIPGSVTNIGDYAFYGCANLAGISIPNSVTSIGNYQFRGCTNLASITIPNGATSIGYSAFAFCASLSKVTIPSGVTSLGSQAFTYCTSLTGVCFQGNAPSLASFVFEGDNLATVYYLRGTTGWLATYGGRPTRLWQPLMQINDASFGIRTNQFGFTVAWASGQVIVVDACTNLGNPLWTALKTNTLSSDSYYFSDPQWVNYPRRFYRVRSP